MASDTVPAFEEKLVGLSRILHRLETLDETALNNRRLVMTDLGKAYAFAFITQGYLTPIIKGEPHTGTGMALCLIGFSYHILISAWPRVIR